MYRHILGLALLASPAAAFAQDATSNVYQLGELQVTARSQEGETLGGYVVSGATLQAYDKQTVEQALALVPGANGSNTGGSRNERVIYVRGFDRFQTTLSVDGVRVFLPADNRIDFARFLTANLSEVQVSKGYVSVMDGPGGLGGAVNLVTIKPTRALEGEVQATTFLDRRLNDDANLVAGRVGGRTDQFYWQASGEWTKRGSFTLSNHFHPTPLEDGGKRGHSDSRDWTANLKAGWTPNDTDEYSINFTRSKGEKNAPYSVRDAANTRYWDWPYWNVDSLAFLSKTQLTDQLTLRTRVYRNSFDNLLSSFDDINQTTQSLPKAFNSYYKDYAVGGNVELDYQLGADSKLKAAFFARRDVHHERQDGFIKTPATGSPSVNAPYHEPWQTNDENTYSAATEYSTRLAPSLELVLGASYDWTRLREANDVNALAGATVASAPTFLPVNYPLRNNHALNGQAALSWTVDDATKFHLSVSDRARFPTVFERFSSRMGTAVPNPDVRPEGAINYEVGFDHRQGAVKLNGAVFYSRLNDSLIQIPVAVPGFGNVTQTKNAGKGEYYGGEAGIEATLSDTFDLGGNLSYIHRKLVDPTNAAFRPQGVPDMKLFAYADWKFLPKLTIRPNIEYASQRWTVTTTTPLAYYKTGSYFLVNLSADYAVTDMVTVSLGVENIGDQDYQLTDGFPEPGRSFNASVRAKF